MIKSNSDHVLRSVDTAASSTAVKLATMANSSGNLIMSACKRNSLCTCADSENHPNPIKSFCEEKQNCTEHQTSENKKCKLIVASDDQRDRMNSRSASSSQQRNNQQNANDNENNQQQQQQQPQDNSDQQQQQQQNNDQDDNQDDGLARFQMANQMVDHNNNIIEPELMVVDENNNLIGLPDANFDMNNNYWNPAQNNNLERPPNNNPQNGLNDQQQNQQEQQNSNQNNVNERPSQQPNGGSNLSLLKDSTNLKSTQCGSNAGCCKTVDRCANHLQSVQIRQRKKLLELDLNKPRSSNHHQFYSPMTEEQNVIKEEECGGGGVSSTGGHQYVFKRSSSSGRRKKSIQCKKCLTKHLTSKCEKTGSCKLENMSKCEHYHSMDCPTPEGIGDQSKKHVGGFKKASTPLTLCPIATTPTIKEGELVTNANAANPNSCESNLSSEIAQQQANKSSLLDASLLEPNLRESTATSLTASLISAQCPICLFTMNEPSRPNNCQHSFCSLCVIEWAKVS